MYFVATYAPVEGDFADFQGEVTRLIEAVNFADALAIALEHEIKFQAIDFRLENLLLDCD